VHLIQNIHISGTPLWIRTYTTNNKLSVTSWTFPEKNPEANTIVTDLRGWHNSEHLNRNTVLPIEAQLHIRALDLFNNICNQLESSVKKSLARRQLLIKKTTRALAGSLLSSTCYGSMT
jgi:hypothetical protein